MCESDCELKGSSVTSGETLLNMLQGYVDSCGGVAGKAGAGRFPNLAGFCRYCNIGVSELKAWAHEYPAEYEILCSVLEDEALNSSISATLVSAYLKNHFGYGEKPAEKTRVESGDIKLVFEHDILSDGE